MPRPAKWTEDETRKLMRLYPSEICFEEIVDAFPNRTPNAVRLKASRLGLKRPTLPASLLQSSTVLSCSEGNGDSIGYLFRCGECSSWMQLRGDDEVKSVIVCGNCGAKCYFIT